MTATTTEIEKAKAALEPGTRWRHQKTGHAYEVVGVGRMQSADWETRRRGLSVSPVSVDMREIVIYRDCADGPIWVRPRDEFEDGRFEALSALPAPSAPAEMGVGVEPVAWGLFVDGKLFEANKRREEIDDPDMGWRDGIEVRPLYAHPAPAPDAEKDEIARLKAEWNDYRKEVDIVLDRQRAFSETITQVWKALGSPSYGTLGGKSIGELVGDYVTRATVAEGQVAQLEREKGKEKWRADHNAEIGMRWATELGAAEARVTDLQSQVAALVTERDEWKADHQKLYHDLYKPTALERDDLWTRVTAAEARALAAETEWYAKGFDAARKVRVLAAEARATELEGQVAALVEAAESVLTGISIHNALDKDAPARRDDIEGPVVSALASTVHAARALLARIQPALNGREAGR